MPEDYRLWKERIDAVEKKKMLGISSTKTETSLQTSVNTNGRNVIANKSENERLLNETPILIFANAVEAQEVFKDMLASYKVSTTAKLKEVQDLCQNDSRWEVIKAQGDKKQCLAEYQVCDFLFFFVFFYCILSQQTKQLKVEKEQQKIKARKNRDSFLLMLAENTVIDARTRWRDAVLVLQEDARFKSVEDSREREDLFKDFILELEKKEREDLKKLRTSATEYFNSILEGMLVEGKVTRKCVWNDFRKKILEILLRPELKALDESDFRKCFQDLIGRIDDAFRKSERQKKEEHQQELDLKQKEFRKLLENMVKDGSLTTESRWQDVANSPVIINSPAFVQLREIVEETGGMPGYSAGRDIFDQVLSKVQEIYRADRRLIREMLNSVKVKVSHDSKFNDLKTLVLKMGQMKEIDVEGTLSIAIDNVQTEDGEEVEEILTENGTCSVVSSLVSPAVNQSTGVFSPVENSSLINQLRSLMMDRPVSLNVIFAELLDKAEVDFVEETRQIRKCEDRFVALLRESFYSSDHVGITWEDAKKILQRRSAYDVVSKSDRRRLFTLYMDDLMSKMQSISKSVKLKSIAIDSDFKPCDGNIDLVQRKVWFILFCDSFIITNSFCQQRTRSFDEQHGRKIGGERDCGHDSNFSK
jgi:hypothetical protein